jgi:hypothetical protein
MWYGRDNPILVEDEDVATPVERENTVIPLE